MGLYKVGAMLVGTRLLTHLIVQGEEYVMRQDGSVLDTIARLLGKLGMEAPT